MSHNLKSKKGFTLLEVLIAVFIFTIAAVIMTTTLHNVLGVQAETEKHATRIQNLQMSFLLLSRDIGQTIDRPVTNAKGTKENSLLGDASSITLTRGGLPNPGGRLQRSSMQRVRYSLQNGELVRETWPVLDQVASTKPSSRVLMSAVSNMNIEYLDQNGAFRPNWPPTNQANSAALPRGIRITFTLEKWGKITQFFLIMGQAFSA